MANWDALGLGGTGRVDVRGATPPIGNTGPGGAGGMGLLALLRRLSMGMDDRGPEELPQPMSPDPMAERGMAQLLGMIPGPMPQDPAAAGMPMMPPDPGMGMPPDMSGMMGGGGMPMPPDMGGMMGASMPGMMTPEQQQAILQEEEMRRLGASSGY